MTKVVKTKADIAEIHHKLVESLIKSLRLGQISFLASGKFLYEIKTNKTYKAEDSSRDVTFTEFLSRPELPIPGRTIQSRVRTAQALMRVYNFFVLNKKYLEEQLAKIGYWKLDAIVPVIESRPKEEEEWVSKAETLSFEDLCQEIRTKDKSLADLYNCKHKNAFQITKWKCPDCKVDWVYDPRI